MADEIKDIENILDKIELTEEQAEAVIKKLVEWKEEVLRTSEEALKKYEQTIREKLDEEYGAMFEETKGLLQEVYSERLKNALEKLKPILKEELKEEFGVYKKIIENIKSQIIPYLSEKEILQNLEEKTKEIEIIKQKYEKEKGIYKFENLIAEFPEQIKEELRKISYDKIINEKTAIEEFYKNVRLLKIASNQLEEEIKEEIKERNDNFDWDEFKKREKQRLRESSVDPDPDPNPDAVLNIYKTRKKDKLFAKDHDKDKKRDIHYRLKESKLRDKDEEEIDDIIKEALTDETNNIIKENQQTATNKIDYDSDDIVSAIRLRKLAGIK